MVSALYLFVRELLEDLFQCFVLGVVFSTVDVAGVDVVRELVYGGDCEVGFSGSPRALDMDIPTAVFSEQII